MTADPTLDLTTATESGSTASPRSRRAGREAIRARFRGRKRSRELTPRRYLVLPVLLLIAAAFVQRPGKIVSDTKVALVLNPAQFLSTALHLWNPLQDSGSISDQSTGYLVPMGPFFLLTHALGIPPAFAQRMWLALLLVVGFWGLVRLADALGMGNRLGRILGGLAYAVSPFVIARIGDNSALLLGDIMLPWVLLPLVRVTYGRRGEPEQFTGAADTDLQEDFQESQQSAESEESRPARPLSARRAAALSGLAVLLTGGINGTVTIDMLIVPALWLLLMCRGRGAWILRGWWVVAVICATSWWIVSLSLLGKYGVNFVKYTESAQTTTSVTSLSETLRGTADWLAYLSFGKPQVPAANTYVSAPAAITASFLLVIVGLAGLSRLRVPARRFLMASLALGVVAVGAAYAGNPHGVLASQYLHALSGPLGALRNINKFQPLIRLPIALGLANCVPLIVAGFKRHRRWRYAFNGLTAALLTAMIVLGAAPLGLSRLYEAGSFTSVPNYWKAAASWLNKESNGTRTLLVPGSGFGSYTWGNPQDQPMLWLSTTPWAIRDIIPLGGVNSTRWLDGIENQLEQRATPALANTLARAGYTYVLVRNDLPKTSNDTPPSTDEVHTALAYSGLRRVASFGPLVAGRPTGIQEFLHTPAPAGRYPSLEIYALPKSADRVDSYPADSLAVLSGGPEAMPLLADTSVLGNRPTVLAADVAAGKAGDAQLPAGLKPTTWIDTDTLTRRDEQFGSIHAGRSYLLASGQSAAGEKSAPQVRLDVDPNGHQTVAVFGGIKSVTASHYGFVLGTVPSSGPPAAVDGDPTTAWSVSGYPKNGVGQWLQLSFTKPVSTPDVSVRFLAEAKKRVRITSLRVTTDSGSLVTSVRDTESPQLIALPPGPTKTLRFTILAVTGGGAQRTFYGPGIREVTVPGITITQTAALPNDASTYFPPGGASTVAYLFARDRADPHSFLDLDVERQLNRVFTVPRKAEFIAAGTAVDRSTQPPAGAKGSTVALACGSGPVVQIDKTKYETYVRGSRSDLTAGQPVSLGLCTFKPITLTAGKHTIRTLPSSSPQARPSLEIATLTLTTGSTKTEPSRPVTVTKWGDESRQVKVAAGTRSILTIHENFNKSWKATVDGKQLTPIRVDGWQQGFIVPASGAVVVHLDNAPGKTYRLALLLSALLVLGLLIAAAWPSRRSRVISPPRAWSPAVVRVAALLTAVVTTLLVAGPIVAAFVPVLAIIAWYIPASPAILAFAGLGVAGGVTLAHQAAYSGSHQGTFSATAQVAAALALAVVLVSAGRRQKAGDAGSTELPEERSGDHPGSSTPPADSERSQDSAPEAQEVSEPDEKGSY